MPREYGSANAFRRALEDRLNRAAEIEQIQINRLRRQVAFDRFLARLFHTTPAPWLLKGGYALELRFRTARATVDIDLTLASVNRKAESEANEALRDLLEGAASIRLGDWFDFRIGAPTMDLDAAPYGGARFPVEGRMDSRIFARFHVDASIGDEVIQPVERIECRDWLEFALIPSPVVHAISPEQQFAEKLHAYTLPRATANSRVKDLVDMTLLIRSGRLTPGLVGKALEVTFRRRGTHDVPSTLQPPPQNWRPRFLALAAECELPADIDAAYAGLAAFLTPSKTS